jgi:hypothetical protein
MYAANAQSIAALVMEGRAVGGSNAFILFLHSCGTWCAAPPGFRNLLLDPVGLGETRIDAVRALLSHPEFVQRSSKGEWPTCIGYSAPSSRCQLRIARSAPIASPSRKARETVQSAAGNLSELSRLMRHQAAIAG